MSAKKNYTRKAKANMFTRDEVAKAYALAAERILGNDDFLRTDSAVFPIFLSLLFQSLENSIKYAGIHSGLFTEDEAREKRSGHGIKELAMLVAEKLAPMKPCALELTEEEMLLSTIVGLITRFNTQKRQSWEILSFMIYRDEFKETRDAYAYRRLSYGEIADNEIELLPLLPWVEAVKQTAEHLPDIVAVLSKHKTSGHLDTLLSDL